MEFLKKYLSYDRLQSRYVLAMQELGERRYIPPLGWFFYHHCWLFIFIHFVSFSVIAETGAEWLEPAAINWFWSPIIALALYPDFVVLPSTRFGILLQKYPRLSLWGNWAISALLVPYLIWDQLKLFDEKVAHPFRDAVGRAIGLGGQTNLLILLCMVILGITIVHEVSVFKRKKKKKSYHEL